MPQPKGFEPFTRTYTVTWNVLVKAGSAPAGSIISRPRIQIFTSKADADAWYDSLNATAKYAAGYPQAGSISAPLLEKFYNKKTFIYQFLNGKFDQLLVSS
jgi:hypothetical protein